MADTGRATLDTKLRRLATLQQLHWEPGLTHCANTSCALTLAHSGPCCCDPCELADLTLPPSRQRGTA